jgi:hypothetical protein
MLKNSPTKFYLPVLKKEFTAILGPQKSVQLNELISQHASVPKRNRNNLMNESKIPKF